MAAEAPLSGVTIVELGGSVAAPYAGEILADLGARVIKIEKRDGGDDARRWAPPYWHGVPAIFQSLNRNKLSVAIDLRDADELARLRRLVVEEADILLQNLRPGAVAEFGLDAATLRRAAPRLIHCSIGAFGAAGPLKDRPGYDPLMQAFGGLMSVTGEEGRPPVRIGTSIVDMGSGMWAVIGVLAALHRRAATGEGCTIDGSLYETALGWMTYHAATYQASGELPRRAGSGNPSIVPYRAFPTSDGDIVVGAANDKLFRRLAEVLGRPDWVEDERFRGNPERVAHQDELHALIEAVMAGASTAEWQARLEAAGVPCAPLQTVDQVLSHPQTEALGMLQRSADGKFALMGLPLSFDGKRPPLNAASPSLGEHNAEVLGDRPQKGAAS